MKRAAQVRLELLSDTVRARGAGVLLCVAGAVACVTVGYAFNTRLVEKRDIEAQLEARTRSHHRVERVAPDSAAAAAAIERELSVPWSSLLAQLESASADVSSTVALLQVEPDPAKRIVTITAEARTLPDALAYLERLQKCTALRYPMLESHELRKDDSEHPFRFKIAAQWRT
ncbi:MAG: hypothetical protein JSR66_17465 [Proteobacteria bacterium]|nr:hypothetical protein [Pseudomonadota bacterium]